MGNDSGNVNGFNNGNNNGNQNGNNAGNFKKDPFWHHFSIAFCQSDFSIIII